MEHKFSGPNWLIIRPVGPPPIQGPLTQAYIDDWRRHRRPTPENRYALRTRVQALVAMIRRRRR